ncbi:HDOD domain-containing protein [Neptunomonas antarctica]|uniref:HD-like signal output (HDOD) domain, no enzymatic activity n=1 Tax=Neptunomonas antarctica TaxID=619304 RepID=A0A1N7MM32_9GAMM|nr:HDOD domain-containing protein [Neptunomonas antarctica]SIS87068.1 HD-like signal output (HDOD) domain, no enzymatic activity [Neptunomonas antarctica]
MAIGVNTLGEVAGQANDVRLVLLHDNVGKVLVLLPATVLLNLVSIWRDTERHLQPVKGDDVKRFFSQEKLLTEGGQKKLFSLPVFIDVKCEALDTLNIIEPYSGLRFSANRSWYMAGMRSLRLGVSLSDIDKVQPSGDDETVISHAVERFTALRIRQRLEDTLGLPSLAPTTQKIIMLRSDDAAGVDRLVPVVKVDPSLSAQVMSWSVSPYYAAPGSIQSIDDAIIRVLGFDLVVNLALGIAMGKTLSLPDDTPRNQTPYWQQAVYTATLAERLAKKMSNDIRPKPGLVYLAGLLHNFGYIVLAHLFPPHFSLLSRYIEANPHLRLDYIEKHILHVTREQVGAWLMESWSLPEEVFNGIRYLNDPLNSKADAYSQVIHLANHALRQSGLADGPVDHVLNPEVLVRTGLTQAEITAEVELMQVDSESLLEFTHSLADH